ncbi:MAG: ribosome silencing factor [Clostridia bacterium]|nr:ribosome silencing factor [Clostridia bacterium]
MDNTQNTAEQNEAKTDSLVLAEEIVKILDANKAGQLKLLRVNDQTVMTDYFVICTGNSNTHIKSLSGEVEYKLGEQGVKPTGIDGYDSGIWIVMDYGHVMLHIFNREQRDFFKLEKLWADAEDINIENIITED